MVRMLGCHRLHLEEFDADLNLWHRIIHPGDLFAVTEYEKKVLKGSSINLGIPISIKTALFVGKEYSCFTF
jgi:hypothetical protein